MSIDWPQFAECVQQYQHFILTTHARPDCDALGSELGMKFILESIGKQVTIVNPDAPPERLGFIDPDNQIQVIGRDWQPNDLPNADALMVLDTSAWKQLDTMADVVRNFSGAKIVLDHHVSSDDLSAKEFKEVTSESTGGLVVEAAKQFGVSFNTSAATAVFAAMATDTGWFRFNSTKSSTYRKAAELIDAGVDLSALYHQLYEQQSLARFDLMNTVMETLEFHFDGSVAFLTVLQEAFETSGALLSDTEGFVNVPLALQNVESSVILVQQPDLESWRMSFRSHDAIDCSRLAGAFGGGGHKAAAGASFTGTLAELKSAIIAEIEKLRS